MSEVSRYVDYFISGPEQAAILVAALALMLGLAAVGRLLAGRNGFAEAELFGGWALVVTLMTAGNVLFRIPFDWVFWPSAGAAVLAAVYLARRERRVGPAGWWRVALLALPLLLIASARMASEWDEFSHWLPTARFIVESQRFPTGAAGENGGQFPGYPFAWPLLVYMANMLAGRAVESAGSTLNILLLLTFGIGAVRLWCDAVGRPMSSGAALGWTGALFAVLVATLLNPTFVQKVVMTVYADASTAAAVGIATVLMHFTLSALAVGNDARARVLAWQLGLVLLVLVDIKQTNLIAVVLLMTGCGLAALRDPDIKLTAFLRLAPIMLAPAVLIYVIWRYHIAAHLPASSEATFMPFAQWNLHILWPILKQMLIIAGKKFGYFGVMAVAAVFAVRALIRCRGPFDRMALIVGVTFLGHNAFLYMTFVTHFGEFDASRAVSFWRYNHHLGLMAVAFGAFGLGVLWRRRMGERDLPRLATAALLALVVAAPFVFAEKLRFDYEHPKPFYRAVATELTTLMPEGSRVFILDPKGTGESAVLSVYPLGNRQNEHVGYLAAFHGVTAKLIQTVLARTPPSHLLVHSVTPEVNAALNMALAETGQSYLLKKDGDGWRIVKSWARSDDHWAGK